MNICVRNNLLCNMAVFMLVFTQFAYAMNNSKVLSEVTYCSNNQDLQICINNAQTNIVSLKKGNYITNGFKISSNVTFIVPYGVKIKLADDAELNKDAFGGVANSVISCKGSENNLLENIHIVIDGEIDGNKEQHPYENGGVEGVDWLWVKNSSITGSGVIHSANGDGIDLDAVNNIKIEGVTVKNNGGSGIHFGSPRPIKPSKDNIVINVKSIGNGFELDRNGLDLSWPNPAGAIFVNCIAIDNYRNYQIEAETGFIFNSLSVNNGAVIEEDDLGGADYAYINGKDITDTAIISEKTKVLIKRDIKKLLGMEYPEYLDDISY